MSTPLVWAIKDLNGSLLSLSGSGGGNVDWARVKPEENDKNLFNQLWLLEEVPNTSPQTFKLRALASGTVLTVAENWTYGNNINGNHLYGSSDPTLWSTQQWTFENLNNGKYLIKSYAKGTALEPYQDSSGQWVGVSNVTRSDGQSWVFECRSRSSTEIENMLGANSRVKSAAHRQHYAGDGTYVTLPAVVRQEIWENSLLGYKDGNPRKYPWRNQVFDCDDFSVVMKSEVAKWAADNLKTDFFALLIGICWGDRPDDKGIHAHHAFNWYLTPDLKDITYYEPQTGVEDANAQGYMIYYTSF